MSTAEERTEPDGQVVIDGFPLRERLIGCQGQIAVKPELYDELALGSTLRVTLDLEVVSRTDRKKRSKFDDDEAHRALGVSILATKKATVVTLDPPMQPVDGEDESPADEVPEPRKGRKRGARATRAAGLRPVPDEPEKPAETPEGPAE